MKTLALIAAALGTTLMGVLAVPAAAQVTQVTTLIDRADPPFDGVELDPFALPCGSGTLSDLPGADGLVSLREAITAANDTAGPQTITFAPALRGGTIRVDFDTLDLDAAPDPLPFLCDAETTIDGDLDGDDVPDITLDGSAIPLAADGIDDGLLIASRDITVNALRVQAFPSGGIGIVHLSSFPDTEAADNTISNNIVTRVPAPIFINAGLTIPFVGPVGGLVSGTRITGNTVSNATPCGICILTGDAPDSEIAATTISDNRVMSGTQLGILVQTGSSAAGADTTISTTTISGNEVAGNGSNGIVAVGFQGTRHTITRLAIRDNDVHDNQFTGIVLTATFCGGSDNLMRATVAGNVLARNAPRDATSGVFAGGGLNLNCAATPSPAERNHLEVSITDNIIADEPGAAIGIVGGGGLGASHNEVTATVAGNRLNRSGGSALAVIGGLGDGQGTTDGNIVVADLGRNAIKDNVGGGITVVGGIGTADQNLVTVTVADNAVRDSGDFGLALTGGINASGSQNTVAGMVVRNTLCGNRGPDLACAGGDEQGAVPDAFGASTGNQVTGEMTHNAAATFSVADGCRAERHQNTTCACQGDCDGSADVSVDELLRGVNIALGNDPANGCLAFDADLSDSVTMDELISAVDVALRGCRGE